MYHMYVYIYNQTWQAGKCAVNGGFKTREECGSTHQQTCSQSRSCGSTGSSSAPQKIDLTSSTISLVGLPMILSGSLD